MIQINNNNTKNSCSIHYNEGIRNYYASAAKAQSNFKKYYICGIGIFFYQFCDICFL